MRIVLLLMLLMAGCHWITYYEDPLGPRTKGIVEVSKPVDVNRDKTDHTRFFEALRFVETGGGVEDGDGGNSIGPFQISLAYFQDAGLRKGSYNDCRNAAYAKKVIQRYMDRYAPGALEAGDYETVARIHNGGPRGAFKVSTRKYWLKVKAYMEAVK